MVYFILDLVYLITNGVFGLLMLLAISYELEAYNGAP